jgi:hypothetical protein
MRIFEVVEPDAAGQTDFIVVRLSETSIVLPSNIPFRFLLNLAKVKHI